MSNAERVGKRGERWVAMGSLKLYALYFWGLGGWHHSIDYPQVWTTKRGAERYWKVIDPIPRKNYKIFKFRCVR